MSTEHLLHSHQKSLISVNKETIKAHVSNHTRVASKCERSTGEQRKQKRPTFSKPPNKMEKESSTPLVPAPARQMVSLKKQPGSASSTQKRGGEGFWSDGDEKDLATAYEATDA